MIVNSDSKNDMVGFKRFKCDYLSDYIGDNQMITSERSITKMLFNSLILVGIYMAVFFILSAKHAESSTTFSDQTLQAGIAAEGSPTYGVSWADFDNNGWVDLHIRNHGQPPTLFKNMGDQTFEDITSQAGFSFKADFHGASCADFDNDGDQDLYQMIGAAHGTGEKNNYLFINEGQTTFADIAASAGVNDTLGRGRTPLWFDYNNDGRLDLFLANFERADAPSRLFENNSQNLFVDVTQDAGLEGVQGEVGAYTADMDMDGLMDLIVSDPGGVGLYLNNGDNTFTNYSELSGLSHIRYARDLALGDYDNDGDVDLFICRGAGANSDAYEIIENQLDYRIILSGQKKGFDFKVTGSTSLTFLLGFEQGAIGIDQVYIGQGKQHPLAIPFTLDAMQKETCGEPAMSDSGVYIWYDEVQSLWHIRYFAELTDALHVCGGRISTFGFLSDLGTMNLSTDAPVVNNRLLANQGDATFIDVTFAAGLGTYTGNTESVVFADVDNDADLDLYVVYSGSMSNSPNRLFENDGLGHFVDVTNSSNAQAVVEGRGESAAVADYDNNGFLDILVLNGAGEFPACMGQRTLLKNMGNNNNWIKIRPVGRISNADAIGVRVKICTNTLQISKQVTGGVHRVSQNEAQLHFGLAEEDLVNTVDITWPSGIVQQMSNISVNQALTIYEPLVDVSVACDQVFLAPGEVLRPTITVSNHSGELVPVLLAVNLTFDNGITYPPAPSYLIGPLTVALGPGQHISKTIEHPIPRRALFQGRFTYNVLLNNEDGQIMDESRFDFYITP